MLNRVLVASAVGLIAMACSDAPEPAPAWRAPVRLAKDIVAERSPVVLRLAGPGLAELEWLDAETGALQRAGSPSATSQQHLLHLFELGAGDSVSVRARLAMAEELRSAEACKGLQLVRLAVLAEGGDEQHSLDAYRLAGGLPHPSGRREPLGKAALRVSSAGQPTSFARWASPPAADGFAGARIVLPVHEQRTLWAALLAAPSGAGELELNQLEVVRKPLFERLEDGLQVPEGWATTATAVWSELKVGSEVRVSLVVPPGVPVALPVPRPAPASLEAAERLSMGVCVAPGQTLGAVARWRVSLRRGAPPEAVLLASGELVVSEREPLRIHFQDVDLPLPAAAGSAASPWTAGAPQDQLLFEVQGEARVAFGAPVLLTPAPAQRPPNLLLVSLDTLRADRLSCYGYERPTSPRLDAFASQAIRFEDAQSVAPYTLPSQVSLLTGLLPLSHGVNDSGTDRLDAVAVPYLPKLLADSGWLTAAFTGGGYVSADYGFASGFDRFSSIDPFLAVPAVQAHSGTGAVGSWIGRHADVPWFLFLHTFATHDYRPEAEDFELFDTRTTDRPLTFFPGPDGRKDLAPSPEQLEDMNNLYDASIRSADRTMGRLLGGLEQQGLLDNTIVVITSDHGEEFGEHGGMRHARNLHREMLHVPLIVRLPKPAGSEKRTPGRVIREVVSTTDLYPTLLELLGVPQPIQVDGRSLASLLAPEGLPGVPRDANDDTPAERPAPILLGHIDTHTSRRSSLQVGALKVIRGDTSSAVEFPAASPWQLFNVRDDPAEQHDLAQRQKEDLDTLRQHLETLEAGLRSRAAPASLGALDEAVLEQLRALGYVR